MPMMLLPEGAFDRLSDEQAAELYAALKPLFDELDAARAALWKAHREAQQAVEALPGLFAEEAA